jgi:AcrR family transcriptional regulator
VTATGVSTRERLLEAAIAYVSEHGVADVSLRQLAADIGTSHRMLIYHFGSKEGLLVEVVRAVEARERALLASFPFDSPPSSAETMRLMWKHISDPAVWPNERLFFEVYGQALQGRSPEVSVLDGIVDDWLEPITAMRRAQGVPARVARAQARLDLAVTRGLLLDLLATGDRAGVDKAMMRYIALCEAGFEG